MTRYSAQWISCITIVILRVTSADPWVSRWCICYSTCAISCCRSWTCLSTSVAWHWNSIQCITGIVILESSVTSTRAWITSWRICSATITVIYACSLSCQSASMTRYSTQRISWIAIVILWVTSADSWVRSWCICNSTIAISCVRSWTCLTASVACQWNSIQCITRIIIVEGSVTSTSSWVRGWCICNATITVSHVCSLSCLTASMTRCSIQWIWCITIVILRVTSADPWVRSWCICYSTITISVVRSRTCLSAIVTCQWSSFHYITGIKIVVISITYAFAWVSSWGICVTTITVSRVWSLSCQSAKVTSCATQCIACITIVILRITSAGPWVCSWCICYSTIAISWVRSLTCLSASVACQWNSIQWVIWIAIVVIRITNTFTWVSSWRICCATIAVSRIWSLSCRSASVTSCATQCIACITIVILRVTSASPRVSSWCICYATIAFSRARSLTCLSASMACYSYSIQCITGIGILEIRVTSANAWVSSWCICHATIAFSCALSLTSHTACVTK